MSNTFKKLNNKINVKLKYEWLLYVYMGPLILCGGLNEIGSCKLICLNTWSPVNRTVWEELAGLALLEEVCH